MFKQIFDFIFQAGLRRFGFYARRRQIGFGLNVLEIAFQAFDPTGQFLLLLAQFFILALLGTQSLAQRRIGKPRIQLADDITENDKKDNGNA